MSGEVTRSPIGSNKGIFDQVSKLYSNTLFKCIIITRIRWFDGSIQLLTTVVKIASDVVFFFFCWGEYCQKFPHIASLPFLVKSQGVLEVNQKYDTEFRWGAHHYHSTRILEKIW